jgi:site-specific recombinase XerD
MKKSRRRSPKAVLRLPDLEHAKSAVLNSLASSESRRSYEFAIQNFVHWYCSEPRLAFNRIVVTRYRMQLEQLHLAPSTINQRLAAVRRLAPSAETLRGKRDRAILAVLLGCGLRRSELVHLKWEDVQQREGHWAIVDLVGKGGHIRTVPIPDWVKKRVDEWTAAQRQLPAVCSGRLTKAEVFGEMG